MAKKRRVFEQGHRRKLMVVVDESPEVEGALFYAAGRASHTGAHVLLLYVIEPDNQFWDGVRQVQLEEQTNKAKALFPPVPPQAQQRRARHGADRGGDPRGQEGRRHPASRSTRTRTSPCWCSAPPRKPPAPARWCPRWRPAPTAGKFPIPITVVPGELALEDIKALA